MRLLVSALSLSSLLSQTDVEWSHCEEKFDSTEEMKDHIEEHLEEIKEIDKEYLKNGCELFACNKCTFNSNDTEKIKMHLSNHIRNDPPGSRSNEASMKVDVDKDVHYKDVEKAPEVRKYNWRDKFDDLGKFIRPVTSDDDSEADANE